MEFMNEKHKAALCPPRWEISMGYVFVLGSETPNSSPAIRFNCIWLLLGCSDLKTCDVNFTGHQTCPWCIMIRLQTLRVVGNKLHDILEVCYNQFGSISMVNSSLHHSPISFCTKYLSGWTVCRTYETVMDLGEAVLILMLFSPSFRSSSIRKPQIRLRIALLLQ